MTDFLSQFERAVDDGVELMAARDLIAKATGGAE